MIIDAKCGKGRLIAIPAVHYVASFAAAVNGVFKKHDNPPSAVAVEMGQGAVDAIVGWFRNFGVGPDSVTNLPVMLGIARKNRLIHPKHRLLALELQQSYGLPLEDLPAEVLKEHLGYASASLICLSATDSMIEALRCSVEWGIPAFGIDLEEFASPQYGECLIEDPRGTSSNLKSYVDRNAPLASRSFDRYIDTRREAAMAARLKRIGVDFNPVLYSGGLAHWERLNESIQDPMIKQSTDFAKTSDAVYHRVLVDPLLAIQHMDVLPEVTTRFEQARFIPDANIDPDRLYEGLKRTAFKMAEEISEPSERQLLGPFFQFLSNLCLVRQKPLPSIFDCVTAAKAMVSREFSGRLGGALLRNNINWANPDDWSNLAILKASPPNRRSRNRFTSEESVRLCIDGSDKDSFYLDNCRSRNFDNLDTRIASPMKRFQESLDSAKQNFSSFFGNCWAWHPRENLLYGTAYEAADRVIARARKTEVEPFAGSLHDGLDIKATLRSFAKGERRPQIRRNCNGNYSYREALQEPVVFLFSLKQMEKNWSWDLARAAADLSPHVKDPLKYSRIRKERGNCFIANISLSENGKAERRLRHWGGSVKLLWGTTTFGNPCNNTLQAARWAEACDYADFPILPSTSFSALATHYQDQFGMELDRRDWTTTLVRLAIPYAKKRVVVVGPDHYQMPGAALRDARVRRIDLEFVPLSQFSYSRVALIRRQYYFSGLDEEGKAIPRELEALMGETIDNHSSLLPEWVQAQRKP